MTPPRILAFGGWDHGEGYPRAEALFAGLRATGVEVVECRFDAPTGGRDKQRLLRSPWAWPRYWLRQRGTRRGAEALLRQAITAHRPDALLVPYPGHVAVRWARRLWAGPLVLDLFLSAFDTAVIDRRLVREGSLVAGLLRRLDREACLAADLALVDTPQNAAFCSGLTDLPASRFGWVPVSDPRECRAAPLPVRAMGEPIELLFFGTGVPLHGLPILLDAVWATAGVRLTLVGGDAESRRRVARRGDPRIRLEAEFVPMSRLRELLARSDLVAGIFGTSDKADRVIPFKVVHALAAGRPVITRESSAARELLLPGVDCLLVRPGDPAAIAERLAMVVADPAVLVSLGRAARQSYEQRFSVAVTGARMRGQLEAVLAARAGAFA